MATLYRVEYEDGELVMIAPLSVISHCFRFNRNVERSIERNCVGLNRCFVYTGLIGRERTDYCITIV